ncbi:MAG: cyclic nucleotide-binding domain-containing protein [Cyanobacteria bacterium P01_E01_bin.42]
MNVTVTGISVLKNDIDSYDLSLPEDEWNRIQTIVSEFTFAKKSVIFSQAIVCDRIFFIADGIAASEQTLAEGTSPIARFFCRGQFCSNITSALMKDYANDTLIAIADVRVVSFPIYFFLQEYYDGKILGEYFRRKVLETLLFDKEIICAKTVLNTEYRYRFLEERQPEVIQLVPDKDIARFMGITPQGLCRFLKNRSQKN